ncbi:hypothetical protein [Roseibium salinum]|uniref:Uncharacterized protein n=1 Tax=Roseibium salinum TaxID=1604349 RepID=A0ABT3R7G8_9HYPH|nr:hypothetical protein [Roseibium sp. DSM 29163]MCX2725050.1 hypothetical protein [Roseibium sp. DSM 29163]
MFMLLTLTGLAVFGALVLAAISWRNSMWTQTKVRKLSVSEERQQKILAPKADFSMRNRSRRAASPDQPRV